MDEHLLSFAHRKARRDTQSILNERDAALKAVADAHTPYDAHGNPVDEVHDAIITGDRRLLCETLTQIESERVSKKLAELLGYGELI